MKGKIVWMNVTINQESVDGVVIKDTVVKWMMYQMDVMVPVELTIINVYFLFIQQPIMSFPARDLIMTVPPGIPGLLVPVH